MADVVLRRVHVDAEGNENIQKRHVRPPYLLANLQYNFLMTGSRQRQRSSTATHLGFRRGSELKEAGSRQQWRFGWRGGTVFEAYKGWAERMGVGHSENGCGQVFTSDTAAREETSPGRNRLRVRDDMVGPSR
jgi:hypothetical protein